jgi:hypothetical protein
LAAGAALEDPSAHPKAVTEKIPSPRAVDGALRFVDAEPEFSEESSQVFEDPEACPFRSHIDVAVVCVSDEGVPSSFQFFIDYVEEHVREERRERTALWRALVPFRCDTVRHHPCFEKTADDPQQPRVGHELREHSHEDVVVHSIEKLFEIDIDDPVSTGQDVLLSLADGVMRSASWTETMAVFGKLRIQQRL